MNRKIQDETKEEIIEGFTKVYWRFVVFNKKKIE